MVRVGDLIVTLWLTGAQPSALEPSNEGSLASATSAVGHVESINSITAGIADGTVIDSDQRPSAKACSALA